MAKHSTHVRLDSIPEDLGKRLDADILRENPHAKQLQAFRRAKILYALDCYLSVRERLAGGLQRDEDREMRDRKLPFTLGEKKGLAPIFGAIPELTVKDGISTQTEVRMVEQDGDNLIARAVHPDYKDPEIAVANS